MARPSPAQSEGKQHAPHLSDVYSEKNVKPRHTETALGESDDRGRKPIPSLEASGQATGLLTGGVLALVVGVVGTVLSWPRLEVDGAGQLTSSGSAPGLAIFGLVAAVGEVLVLIAVIAYGVRLGVRAAGLRDDVVSGG